jgi:L-iduronidase
MLRWLDRILKSGEDLLKLLSSAVKPLFAVFTSCLILFPATGMAQSGIEIQVNEDAGAFEHFWQSTGFTPAIELLDAPMQQQLAYAGAIPHGGLTFIRIHAMLNLVKIEGDYENFTCDWTDLDKGLDVLIRNDLKPFFELMGNPNSFFTNLDEDAQLMAWKNFVRDLALHCIERYGQEEVRSWYFEDWNEPVAKLGREDLDVPWQHSVDAMIRYHDACQAGLHEADPELIFGGLGSCRGKHDAVLAGWEHFARGKNSLSGRSAMPDFLSIHEKGSGENHGEEIIHDTLGLVKLIRSDYPELAGLPFMNNEGDPQGGWSSGRPWRATAYYPAIIARNIGMHLFIFKDRHQIPLVLLSNDHGFLGDWYQRTLCAWFHGDGQSGEGFDLIRQPCLSVLTLLSMLGDRRCELSDSYGPYDTIGTLATRRGQDQYAILFYNAADNGETTGVTPVQLDIEGLPDDTFRLVHYRIDDQHGNPHTTWQQQGAPASPSVDQFNHMRLHEEPVLFEPLLDMKPVDGEIKLNFDMPLPGVSLFLLNKRPSEAPGRVTNLRLETYKGLNGDSQVLLLWDEPASRMIRTYEVLFSNSPTGPFQRINSADQMTTTFLHTPAPEKGWYQVRAVDFWNRAGEASSAVSLDAARPIGGVWNIHQPIY